MAKKVSVLGVLVLLLGAVAGPLTVSAEGDPLASPTPFTPERITAPEISGINPEVVLSEGNQGETHPSDSFYPHDLQLPFQLQPPKHIDIVPLSTQDANLFSGNLAVPLRIQGVGGVTCGLAALGMAMDFLDLGSNDITPKHNQLVSFLSRQDLLYQWGTGVEELAYTAREFGYRGSYAFFNWSLDQLKDQLNKGQPLVTALGTNGKDQPGHFVTVTGISDDGSLVAYNDPLLGKVTVTREEFLKNWNYQANAGVIVQKKQLSTADDPFLPWMGFFSALSMLVVIANRSKGLDQAYNGLRRKLSNPKRKGIGGGPLPPEHSDIETVKEQKYEYKTIYRGIKTIKVEVPVYETRRIKVGLRGVKKKVPKYELKKVQVGFETITKQVPVYITKKVQVGTRLVEKRIPVTRYRTTRVMKWKKIIKKVPVYKKIGTRRIMVGSRTQTSWKRVPEIKRIPYQSTKIITYRVPLYREVRVLNGHRKETEKIPKYVDKKVLVGYEIINETKPVYEQQRIQVGTKTITSKMPDYQTVKIPLRDDPPPPKMDDGVIEDLRLIEKLCDQSDAPTPPTGFSNEVWDSLSVNDQKKIKDKNIQESESNWLISSLEFINDNIFQPLKEYKKHPDHILNIIDPGKIPPIMSVSAKAKWDFHLFTQEGVLASTYLPPKFLKIFYMQQKFNIEPKSVITVNPDALINFEFTSATGSVKLGKNVKYIFGPGEMGVSLKKPSDIELFDYQYEKHSVLLSWQGLSYKYKKEGILIDTNKSSEKFQSKTVSTLKCDTKTITTEGILIPVLIAIGGYEFALLLLSSGLLDNILIGVPVG